MEKSLKFFQHCKMFSSPCFSLRFSLTLFLHQPDSILFLFIFLETLIFWTSSLSLQCWNRFILEKQANEILSVISFRDWEWGRMCALPPSFARLCVYICLHWTKGDSLISKYLEQNKEWLGSCVTLHFLYCFSSETCATVCHCEENDGVPLCAARSLVYSIASITVNVLESS